jgi:hypothetical protein
VPDLLFDLIYFIGTLLSEMSHAWDANYFHKPWEYVGAAWKYRFGSCLAHGDALDRYGRCTHDSSWE